MSGPRPPLRLFIGRHLDTSIAQKAVACAVRKAGLAKRHVPHPQALVCDALAAGGLRHPDRLGLGGPQGGENRHDLYPCFESW